LTDAPDETAPSPPLRPSQRRQRLFGRIAVVLASVLAMVVLTGLAVRLAALTPMGRDFVAARLEGLPLGSIGKLHIEGLEGDLGGDFTLRRLAIVDAKGAWLDARGVHIRWNWLALLVRRAQIDALFVDSVLVSRPPAEAPRASGLAGALPVTIVLHDVRLRLETLPAISVQRGLFQVAGRLDLARHGGLGGELHGKSLLHPGDGLDCQFNFGLRKRLLLVARAREAQGGAIAGLAGLPANQPFLLDANADGGSDHGQVHVKALSGAMSIAQIDGGWTKAGGAGQGRISLAASRWTAGWMRQVGPEVRLFGDGRGLGEDRYDLTLQTTSDNATVLLAGVLDAKTLSSPGGLRVKASVNDLSRIVATPAMGRGALTGVWSGGLANWKLAGDLSVEKLAAAGYGLGRVAGLARG